MDKSMCKTFLLVCYFYERTPRWGETRHFYIMLSINTRHCQTNYSMPVIMVRSSKKKSGWLKVIKLPFTVIYFKLFSSNDFKFIPFPGSEAYEKLVDVLDNTTLIKAVKKSSSNGQTSCLEGYHSVINHFAPKMLAFSYLGMLSR